MALNSLLKYLDKRFDDGQVNSPLDFKYMSQVQLVLSTVGAWPHNKFGKNRLAAILSVYNLFLITFGCVSWCLGAVYIRLHAANLSFFDFGHLVLCLIFVLLYLQRIITSRMSKYQNIIKDYLLDFHLFYFRDRSSYAAKVHKQIHILSALFTLFVIYEMCVGISLFTFMPWYNNYKKGMFGDNRPENSTFEHSVYYLLPEDVYTNIKGYWMFFVLNIHTSYNTTIGLCVFDLLLSLIVFQIWGHLRILKHNLLHMPMPVGANGMYSKEENVEIRRLLKENILHHKLIVKFVDDCSDAFSEYLFGFYLLMQLITCILLLEVTTFTAEALAKYGPLTFGMHQQLMQVSILFEMLDTKSQELIDAVYATPWECMDTSNRKTVMILLHRVQTPVSLKAAKVIPVGVNTMSSVLKTTWSYYMMLKTLAGNR